MADHLALLGALVATQNITVDDAILLADYLDHVAEIGAEPMSVMSAVDLALDFFRPPPDVEAAKTAEAVQAAHDAETCPDCGGDMMDADDFDQAVSVWAAIRGIVDKYNYDMFAEHDEPGEC